MQRMRPNIAPEPIQPDLHRCRPGTSNLKDTRRYPQPNIRGNHLDTGNPLGQLTPLPGRQPWPVIRMLSIQGGDLLSSPIRQRLGRAEMREEVPVPLENVELLCRGGLVVTAKGPWAGRAHGVF